MPIIYVAASKANQEWAADVGLGKNVYKLGVADGQTPDEAVAGFAGQSDWKVLASEETDLSEDEALARLGAKLKPVDPNYYPKLRGAQGLFKVNLTAIENSILVALALEGKDPSKLPKVKPIDVAKWLIANAAR